MEKSNVNFKEENDIEVHPNFEGDEDFTEGEDFIELDSENVKSDAESKTEGSPDIANNNTETNTSKVTIDEFINSNSTGEGVKEGSTVNVNNNTDEYKDLIEEVKVDLITTVITKGLFPFPVNVGEVGLFGDYKKVMLANRIKDNQLGCSFQNLFLCFIKQHVDKYEGWYRINVKDVTGKVVEDTICGVNSKAHPELFNKLLALTNADQPGVIKEEDKSRAMSYIVEAILANSFKLIPNFDFFLNFETKGDLEVVLDFMQKLVTILFVRPLVLKESRRHLASDKIKKSDIIISLSIPLAKTTANLYKKFIPINGLVPINYMLEHAAFYSSDMSKRLIKDAVLIDHRKGTSYTNGYKSRLEDVPFITDKGITSINQFGCFVKPGGV